MGSLTCDGETVDFEDPLLAHLQIVIVRKFRTDEAFLLSWLNAVSIGDGRSAIWLTPHMPVHFTFFGSRAPAIDQGWLDALARSASSGSGLIATTQTGELARCTGHRLHHLPR